MTDGRVRDEDSFEDLLECLDSILAYAKVGRTRFMRDPMVRDAVVRRFEMMGEAAKRLSPDFRQRHKDVPWRQLAGFREILIHHYDRVNPDEAWKTIGTALPSLLQALHAVRKAEGW
jgi:uncharacterized protein with HEPN domain